MPSRRQPSPARSSWSIQPVAAGPQPPGSLNGALLGPLVTAVLVGGGLGAHLGARRFSPVWLQRLLGIVLLVASFKLLSQAL
jgi:uncharacterized membrane protein YfcA